MDFCILVLVLKTDQGQAFLFKSERNVCEVLSSLEAISQKVSEFPKVQFPEDSLDWQILEVS